MSTLLKFISIILVITLVTPVFVGCASSNFKQNSESTADTNNVDEGSEDIIDSKPPENEDLNIISNGKSDYVIVYDSDVEAFETAGLSLSNYINDQFGVSLAVYSDQNVPSNNTKRIIIGDVDRNALYVKNKLNEFNDFAIDVCGDDLVLYRYGYLKYTIKAIPSPNGKKFVFNTFGDPAMSMTNFVL